MITPMLRPDLFGGFATHAGDALFEVDTRPSSQRQRRSCATATTAPTTVSGRTSGRGGRCSRTDDPVLANTYAMACAYSPRDDGSVDLPFDVETGAARPDVWERWLEWDPVRLAARRRRAPPGARDLDRRGPRDEYRLDLGATAFRDAVARPASPTTSSGSSSSKGATATSPGGIRCRSPGSSSGCRRRASAHRSGRLPAGAKRLRRTADELGAGSGSPTTHPHPGWGRTLSRRV